MPEFNTIAIILLIALLLLWNLDFLATLLNLGSLKPELPRELADVYNPEKYARSQEYARANSRFGIISSIASLTILLTFWFFGGFAWLDQWSRSLGLTDVPTGLVYVFALLLGNYLLNLPFKVYDTFVLEERFGFNKTTRARETWPSSFCASSICSSPEESSCRYAICRLAAASMAVRFSSKISMPSRRYALAG